MTDGFIDRRGNGPSIRKWHLLKGLDACQVRIAEPVDVCDQEVLRVSRSFVFDTEGPCFDDVTVFYRRSSEKPGAWWGRRKSGRGRGALRFVFPFRKDSYAVHVNEHVNREKIERREGRRGEKGLLEHPLEIGGGCPVGWGQLTKRMMITNAIFRAMIRRLCPKIQRLLLGHEPLCRRLDGPVAEPANLSFCADAEHREGVAFVLLVMERFVGEGWCIGCAHGLTHHVVRPFYIAAG